MTARWAHPGLELRQSKRDVAESAGFDPGEEQYEPLPGPVTPAMARYNHQGSDTGCENCGERCDTCGDRMCARWGPEPRACGVTCEECPCSCTACLRAREDMRDELLNLLERESR